MNNDQLKINNYQLAEGYKQTEFGIIPENWNYDSLQDKVDLISGRHILAQKYNFGGIGTPYLTGPADFKDDTSIVSKWTKEKGVEAEYGDVLITVKGSGSGSSFKLDLPKAVISRQLMALKGKKILQNYLFYIIRNKESELSAKAVGNLIPGLSRTDIFTLKVLLPGAEEQRSLAQALSDVDTLIASLDKLIAKKRNLKTATMQQLLTGKKRLPGFGEGQGYKESAIGLIPKDWEARQLKSTLKSSPQYGINAAAVPYRTSLPAYIRITDISEFGYFAPETLVSVNHQSSDQYYLEEGDLVFARTGASVGKTYLYNSADGRLVFAGFLIRVRPNENILLPHYLSQYVRTKLYWDWVQLMSMRSGQPGINGNEYSQLLVPLPKIREQSAIATVLSDMDAEIVALESRLAKTQAIKQGMMQELLTGRTRLL